MGEQQAVAEWAPGSEWERMCGYGARVWRMVRAKKRPGVRTQVRVSYT